MAQIDLLKEQVKYLTDLTQELSQKTSLAAKIEALQGEFLVESFLASNNLVCSYYPDLSPLEQEVVCSIAVIGQANIVFQVPSHFSDTAALLKKLLGELLAIHKFYQEIGGLIGYHLKVVSLLFEKESKKYQRKSFYHAQGLHVNHKSVLVDRHVLNGIHNLPHMGEIYPIGGAGDRLDLKDEKTGLPLPTAKLMFLGRSLLTGLVRDLQAREFLYYKLYNKQCITPIAMMTSEAKNNHQFVHKICEDNHWFHRPKNAFFPFMQPQSPVITAEGRWSLKSPLQLYLKPAGHGVMWKIAREKGVLRWFKSTHRSKLIIRQINNPIAGVDNGILALQGIGCKEGKAFGFASCDRLVNSAEGVNILTETQKDGAYHYAISNIEYTDFEKNNIEDAPENGSSPFSIYPSNTNILFADIQEVEKALEICSIPGMLINMKSLVPSIDETGHLSEVHGGRLESTMQNLADYMTDISSEKMNPENAHLLKTFLTYNERHKTISVTKKAYKTGSSMQETPEGCYLTVLENNSNLLNQECNFKVPPDNREEIYLKEGPQFHFLYHPALGPLYSVIKQKIRRGTIRNQSELQLEISELDVENLTLKGSLLINCTQPLGHLDEKDLLHFSPRAGRCTLKNVEVENAGIDRSQKNIYWKNQIQRHESLTIQLEENAEFEAIDVTFKGNYKIHVPKNTKMIASMKEGQVEFNWIPITKPSWTWTYQVERDHIAIKKESL